MTIIDQGTLIPLGLAISILGSAVAGAFAHGKNVSKIQTLETRVKDLEMRSEAEVKSAIKESERLTRIETQITFIVDEIKRIGRGASGRTG